MVSGEDCQESRRSGKTESSSSMTEHSISTEKAATLIQGLFRRKHARKRMIDVACRIVEPIYDEEYKRYYYYNHNTGKSSWTKPSILAKVSLMRTAGRWSNIGNSNGEKFKNSENAPNKRDSIINRFGLPGQVKDWSVQNVSAFFESLDYKDYKSAVLKFKVDGLMLLHMAPADWAELGIENRLHIKRIKLHLKQHQENSGVLTPRRPLVLCDDATKDFSELSLSGGEYDAYDAEKKRSLKHVDEGEDDTHSESSGKKNNKSEPEVDENLTTIDVLFPGEIGNTPSDGSVVRMHYSISLLNSDRVIESSRDRRGIPFEFVLGEGNVIKGWDIAVKKLSLGERSKVTIPPEFAYGCEGMMPAVPPNSTLVCDIEVIDFWDRPTWFKPYIQTPGLSQKPYVMQ